MGLSLSDAMLRGFAVGHQNTPNDLCKMYLFIFQMYLLKMLILATSLRGCVVS